MCGTVASGGCHLVCPSLRHGWVNRESVHQWCLHGIGLFCPITTDVTSWATLEKSAIAIKISGLLGGEVAKTSGRRLVAGRASILAVELPAAVLGRGHQTTRHRGVSGWLH